MSDQIASLLEEDHDSVGRLFTELDEELSSSNIARAHELLDLFWARLAVHIRAEHLQLFPAVTNVAAAQFGGNGLPTFTEAQRVVVDLRSDHDFFMKELAQLMRMMRERVSDSSELKRRLSIVKERLDKHNRIEEEQVYVWPSLLFDAQRIAQLGEGVRKELNNLPQRFSPMSDAPLVCRGSGGAFCEAQHSLCNHFDNLFEFDVAMLSISRKPKSFCRSGSQRRARTDEVSTVTR
jgi:hypothetical protein